MNDKEFINKALEYSKMYGEMQNEGVINIWYSDVQMDADIFFKRFNKKQCKKSFHGDEYPTCYEIEKSGLRFFTITKEIYNKNSI